MTSYLITLKLILVAIRDPQPPAAELQILSEKINNITNHESSERFQGRKSSFNADTLSTETTIRSL